MAKLVNICDVCTEIFAGGDAPKGRISPTRTAEYSIPIFSNGEDKAGLYGYTDSARVTEQSITVLDSAYIRQSLIHHTIPSNSRIPSWIRSSSAFSWARSSFVEGYSTGLYSVFLYLLMDRS